MFDADMILLDGSVDLTPSTDTPAVSTTRLDATGAAVIDLGAGGTPASGLSCVIILPDADEDSDTLTAFLEVSDEVAFGDSVLYLQEVAKFSILATTKGEIADTEPPAVVVRRFITDKRYVRLNATVTTGGDFKAVKCYLTPYAFTVL